MVARIVLVVALIHDALLYSVYNLKAVQMNVQRSLIWKLMLYVFESDHDAEEETKNICYEKYKGTVKQ